MLFGGWPYVRLPEGRMRLGLRGQAGSPRRPEQPVVALEVLAPSRWRSRRARASAGDPPESTLRLRAEFGAAELNAGEASFDFTVLDELALDSRVDAPFEFRLLHLGNSALRIDAVDLDRLEGAPAEPSPAQIAAPAIAPRRRKKIVIIGNCQSDILRQGFNWIEGLNRQYEAKYHYVSLLPQNLLDLARRDLEQSDVVLVQDISNWERSPLRDHVPARIEPVTFPGLRIASPWPFDAWNGPADRDAHAREGPNLVFPYQDGLLARLRREIPDQEARFRAYRDLDSPGLVDPKRLHDLEHRRLLAADKKFGFEIGAYILENIRARRIFHTTVRPNRAVLDLLMRHVLKAMGVAGEHHLPEGIEAVLQNAQVPIHPKVAAALGVGWANERTRYLVRGEPITWETYVRRYIAHYG